MTDIKATCPECGDVDLTPRDVNLYRYFGATILRDTDTVYSFMCPNSDHAGIVTKPADKEIAELLTGAKVNIYELHRPREVDDLDRIVIRRQLGRITHNDELDFIIDLNRLPLTEQFTELDSVHK